MKKTLSAILLTCVFTLSLEAYNCYQAPSAPPKPDLGGYNWALSSPTTTTVRHSDGTNTYIQKHGDNSGVIRYSDGTCDYYSR